jgi:heme-degrading monooxygenase HmoA
MNLADTPPPPYYAVIFSSIQTQDIAGYEDMATYMVELAKQQNGFLGFESARNEVGITVSYWRDLSSIKAWKNNVTHLEAQRLGRNQWYEKFRVRICKVELEYGKE